MKVLLDSNVALDAMLVRQPFCVTAAKLLAIAGEGVEFFVSASAVTDLYYICRKETQSGSLAMILLKDLLKAVSIAAVDGDDIRHAITLDWDDFEDAVQYCIGERLSVDCIVSRDESGFQDALLPIFTPEEFLDSLTAG